MSITQFEWGPVQTTTSYRLLMQDPVYPNLVALDCGFGVGQPEFDETNAVERTYYCYDKRAGRLVPKTEVLYGSSIRKIRYPINLPKGKTLFSPIHQFAGKNCPRDLFMVYICPPNVEDNHFIRMPNGRFGAIKPDTAFIEWDGDQDGTPYTATSELTVTEQQTYYHLVASKVQDLTPSLSAIAWIFGECVECDAFEHRVGLYGGTNLLARSTNAFGSGTTITTGLASTAVINGILADGNIVLAVYTDTTTGGVLKSVDGGVTFTDVSPASCKPLNDVIRAGQYYYAVGGTGYIIRSVDGSNWSVVSNTVAASATLYDLAYDPVSRNVYIAGDNSSAGVALMITPQGALINISANVQAAAGSLPILYVVTILGPKHIAFAGASGFFSESVDGGGVYANSVVGSSAIKVLLGDTWRTFVGAGSNLYQRSVANEMTWKPATLAPGQSITGNFLSGASGNNASGANYFAAVTDAGEIFVIAPVFPNAL